MDPNMPGREGARERAGEPQFNLSKIWIPNRYPATETAWIAITGAPCSGKSTLIEMLGKQNYTTATESAREVISEQLELGRTIEEIRANKRELQENVLSRSLTKAVSHDPGSLIFFDRGIPDSVVFWEFNGLSVETPLRASSLYRYKHVFILDLLDFQNDGVRFESGAVAASLDRRLHEVYAELGYEPIRVPRMTPEQRIAFILGHIQRAESPFQ